MKILVLGHGGYIGPVLGSYIRNNDPDIRLIGLDLGLFKNDITGVDLHTNSHYHEEHWQDMRAFDKKFLDGVEAVVALAAVSNDPMGAAFKVATQDINTNAIVEYAKLAKSVGVKKFIFASSCSVYGAGGDRAKTENDSVAPLTDYAVSKIETERKLKELISDTFSVVCLRFATACGVSYRTRLDLVLNDFVWNYLVHDVVEVLSDGSPLRPLIDVTDMSRAIHWALTTSSLGNYEILNCGYNIANFSVREIANAVVGKDLEKVNINKNAAPDKRSYKVDFTKFEKLSGFNSPLKGLETSIDELKVHLEKLIQNNTNTILDQADFKRHQTLKRLISEGKIDQNLFWISEHC